MASLNNAASSAALNLEILAQYTQAIGGQALLGSVDILEQHFPLYIESLVSYHQSGDNKLLVEEAHKMKGAAGSVGLLRMCELSQKIQDSSAADWADNYPEYIETIKLHYAGDVALLREYLMAH
jgi:two-component system aerobic respiration control sensor histidine kinase ArcB